jgi:hypothetical protein
MSWLENLEKGLKSVRDKAEGNFTIENHVSDMWSRAKKSMAHDWKGLTRGKYILTDGHWSDFYERVENVIESHFKAAEKKNVGFGYTFYLAASTILCTTLAIVYNLLAFTASAIHDGVLALKDGVKEIVKALEENNKSSGTSRFF